MPIVVALLLDEVAVDRGAVAGHDHARRTWSGPSTMSRLSGHSIGQESSPNDGASRLLDEVAGQQHVGVGDPHHEVAAGVAAAGVDQLDQPVAEVEGHRGGERVVGQHDLGRQHVVAVRVVGVVGVRAA